jgi:hypothetical protein
MLRPMNPDPPKIVTRFATCPFGDTVASLTIALCLSLPFPGRFAKTRPRPIIGLSPPMQSSATASGFSGASLVLSYSIYAPIAVPARAQQTDEAAANALALPRQI